MERITEGMLKRKVDWLARLGIVVTLDHHQPGGNKRTWAVEDKTGGSRVGYSGRMTALECLIFLCGMIEGAEQMDARKHAQATRHDAARRLNEVQHDEATPVQP